MRKSLLTALMAAAIAFFMSGCSTMHMGWTAVTGQHKLDDGAMPAFDDMFTKVVEYGDPARAMMKEWKVDYGDPARAMMKEFKVAEDVTGDDVKESVSALAEEYNMRVTGYVKMFTKEDAKPDEVREARIWSLCSLYIAKVFLNHSRYFGGFMPCRIMYVQYGNGDAYLITMDLTLAIHGGYPLPPKMLELATEVKKAMTEIPQRAANGDF